MYQLDEHTVSLLHFDNGIKDETGKVWTAQGGAAVTTADSKFGGSSLHIAGAQYLSLTNNGEFSFGTQDFTVECWVKRDENNKLYQNFVTLFSDSGSTAGRGFMLSLANDLRGVFSIFDINTTSFAATGSEIIPIGEWIHIAGVRHGDKIYLYKNGVLEGTGDCTNCNVSPNPATLLNIGTYSNGGWGNFYAGYIDEVRISNIARWAPDIEVPEPPVKPQGVLLRVTMLDSSERNYQLTDSEISGFVNWFNTYTATVPASYKLVKKIGSQESDEYLVFNKIISFEVIKI